MAKLVLDDDAYGALVALANNLSVIGDMFNNGEESPQGLRMAIASIREAATIFERACDRWETA